MALDKVRTCMELGASQEEGLRELEALDVCGTAVIQHLELSDQGGSVRSPCWSDRQDIDHAGFFEFYS